MRNVDKATRRIVNRYRRTEQEQRRHIERVFLGSGGRVLMEAQRTGRSVEAVQREHREAKAAHKHTEHCSEKCWGMSPGGRGFDEARLVKMATAVLLGPGGSKRGAVLYGDEAKLPTKSLKSDLKRKAKLRRVMPGNRDESVGGSGEIAGLLRNTDFAGKPSGMRKGADLYESAKRAFDESYSGIKDAVDSADAHLRRAGLGAQYSGSGPRSQDPPSMSKGRAQRKGLFPDLTTASHPRDLQKRRSTAARKKIAVKKRLASKRAKLGEAAIRAFNETYTGEPIDDGASWRVEQNYRLATIPGRSCGDCKFYDDRGACVKFESMVRAVDTCDAFQPKGGSQ